MSELHTDFLAAFRDGAAFIDSDGRRLEVARVGLGSLEIGSGKVAIGDPMTEMDPVAPPGRMVAPGRYKVDISIVRYPGGDRWVAAARLVFRDEPVTSWVESGLVIPVEGHAGFADGRFEGGLMVRQISTALRESYVNSFSAAIVTGPQGQVAAFSSGTEGGDYTAIWGMTADGEPSQLCLDFRILTEQRTEDWELDLPLRRGEVTASVLKRHGVSANVPLFAPTTLKVTFRAPTFVMARWRGQGPLQQVPSRANVGGLTFDLSAPPAGATLVIRVVVGSQRQRLREVPTAQ